MYLITLSCNFTFPVRYFLVRHELESMITRLPIKTQGEEEVEEEEEAEADTSSRFRAARKFDQKLPSRSKS